MTVNKQIFPQPGDKLVERTPDQQPVLEGSFEFFKAHQDKATDTFCPGTPFGTTPAKSGDSPHEALAYFNPDRTWCWKCGYEL